MFRSYYWMEFRVTPLHYKIFNNNLFGLNFSDVTEAKNSTEVTKLATFYVKS